MALFLVSTILELQPAEDSEIMEPSSRIYQNILISRGVVSDFDPILLNVLIRREDVV